MSARIVTGVLVALLASSPAWVALPAQPVAEETMAPDSGQIATVREARSAHEHRQWDAAADLWREALAGNDRVAEHWDAYGESLYRARRYRESVAAYQRAIQLGAEGAAERTWKVARAYGRLGNEKQAARWRERASALGFHDAGASAEPVLRRARPDDRCRKCVSRGTDRVVT